MQGGEGGSKDWSKSIKGGGPPWRDPPLGQFWSIPNWQATEITQNEPPPVNWNIDKWELQLRSNDLAFVIMYINIVCDVFKKLVQGSKEMWKGQGHKMKPPCDAAFSIPFDWTEAAWRRRLFWWDFRWKKATLFLLSSYSTTVLLVEL